MQMTTLRDLGWTPWIPGNQWLDTFVSIVREGQPMLAWLDSSDAKSEPIDGHDDWPFLRDAMMRFECAANPNRYAYGSMLRRGTLWRDFCHRRSTPAVRDALRAVLAAFDSILTKWGLESFAEQVRCDGVPGKTLASVLDEVEQIRQSLPVLEGWVVGDGVDVEEREAERPSSKFTNDDDSTTKLDLENEVHRITLATRIRDDLDTPITRITADHGVRRRAIYEGKHKSFFASAIYERNAAKEERKCHPSGVEACPTSIGTGQPARLNQDRSPLF